MASLFQWRGSTVQLSGRRPSGKVLVEYVNPRTNRGTGCCGEAWPHELRAPGKTMADVHRAIELLPAATLDNPHAVNGEQPRYWWLDR